MPKKSGRREGEARGRLFAKVARPITRRPMAPRSAAGVTLWLADTLDWLNLWQPGGAELTDDVSHTTANDDLSLRL